MQSTCLLKLLGLMRMLGAQPVKLETLSVCEAECLGLLATARWLWMGQGSNLALGCFLKLDNSQRIGGVVWPTELVVVPCLALLVSLDSALLPAAGAYRVSVRELLQGR